MQILYYKGGVDTSSTGNVSSNIGKPIPPHILDQFDIDRDVSKGSSDTPKEATLINDKDLDLVRTPKVLTWGVCQLHHSVSYPLLISIISP
jgi:hypothetical protein